MDRHGLILWPDSTASFPNIQCSSVFPSLVFTGYTKRTFSHLRHNVQPILDDEDHKSPKGRLNDAEKHRTGRIRRTSGSALSPTSPTKRKEQRHRSSQPHITGVSPSGKVFPSPLIHSPTGPFSPTKQYGHSFPNQPSPSRHQPGLPVSPSWGNRQPYGRLPGDALGGDNHLPMHPSQGRGSMPNPTRHGHTSAAHVLPGLHSPMGPVYPLHKPFSPTR